MRKTIRAILMTLLIVAVALPVALYLFLSTPAAQRIIRSTAVEQLTTLLGTEVNIDRIDYQPFNTLAVQGIRVCDDYGKPALAIALVQARFELWHFLRTGRLMFDYAIIDAPEVALSRQSNDSPLNIQGIISRLSPKDKDKPASAFDLCISTLVVRNGRFSYNVADDPAEEGRFSPSHISLRKISLHAYLRHITSEQYDVLIDALSCQEKSGLMIDRLSADALVSNEKIALRQFMLELPASSLTIKPLEIAISGLGSLPEALTSGQIDLQINAELATDDFLALLPALGPVKRTLAIDLGVAGNLKSINAYRLYISDSRGLTTSLQARVSRLDSIDALSYDISSLRLNASAGDAANIAGNFSPKAAEYIARAERMAVAGRISGDRSSASIDIKASVDDGNIAVNGLCHFLPDFSKGDFKGSVTVDAINAGRLLAEPRLGLITIPANADLAWAKGSQPTAKVRMTRGSVSWLGKSYDNLFALLSYDPTFASIQFSSPNPGASLVVEADGRHAGPLRSLDLSLEVSDFRPEILGLKAFGNNLKASGSVTASLEGHSIDDIVGTVDISDITLISGDDILEMEGLTVEATDRADRRTITLTSDFINGSLEGEFTPSQLMPLLKDIASHIVPALVPAAPHDDAEMPRLEEHNNFNVLLTIDNAESLCKFFHLPVTAVYPVDINATVSADNGSLVLTLDAPYLQQGDKIIDNTSIGLTVLASTGKASFYASTHMPTKKGPMALAIGVEGSDNKLGTTINWEIERAIPINGVLGFDTSLSRAPAGNVCVDVDMRPGQITFGDDVWAINPASISWCERRLTVDDFVLQSGEQRIAIDGIASDDPDDKLTIDLDKIVLVSIFETLEIENAMLTGTATGTFTARKALAGIPLLSTPLLHVDDIGYNYCVLGDADIKAAWDPDNQGFRLDADIVNPQGQRSAIKGYIFPMKESLDLDFQAENVKVGFMQPFMKAFASDITGFASGHAHLFGTFHDIDMEGDIYARDLRLRLDFTNTYYSTSDSVHIRPGIIRLENIVLRDDLGNSAMLNGVLTHTYFHLPEFEFNISDAHNFLCYNVTPKINPDWYGTVYGNGGASVKGKPGTINIGVNMSTTAGSTFTFVLSDQLEAEQYSFITFRDATDYSAHESLLTRDDTPEVVKEYQQRIKQANVDPPSNYIMDIQVDITPDAQVNLVMDPVGGDRIQAYGSGDLRMTYNAFENDLRMYGTYTLDRGSYNFTLQDIIIKDFTIEQGSSIAFRGDPYSAQLNIEAVYQVNANLSDLDESFTQDKDLNRTNVPVQALMKVTGDMRQPDLDFDLRFPTLTSDTYRKVRSIISTDDMMNRQIIYLLALNRFYTPDYMASTTKGNELFSVASSTISSQLSSMLGKLSDNWSIAPNLRSDRGDFSDVEVDVALSSRLLNNRLLFNGNFGYRDKSLNTNQFIGDFDIEYLLNPRGNWRLKAYNRYNDQNYYVRSAATTQGVGILFRRDFDDLFGRHKDPCPEHSDTIPAIAPTAPADTIRLSDTEISEK